ncbi:MAG: ferredoxin family protein [Lachnospiraceae bacterium]|nr:ferredoxin family protein [Lachnospiraceae bacterium]
MSIRINQKKCIGCKRCCDSCPGTLIDIQNNKACMLYPKDCWGCASCVKECPVGAIDFFLGADIGGNGSTMHVESKGDILNWQITKSDGTKKIITINRKDSNKY